jgi:hypothetical protein
VDAAFGSALLSAVSALVGVALGGWLAKRGEHRQWLREQRFIAYREVMIAARQMLWTGAGIGMGTGSLEQERDAVRTTMFQLRQAVAVARMVAPSAVSDAMKRLQTYYGDELWNYYMSSSSSQPTTASAPPVIEAQGLLAELQRAVQKAPRGEDRLVGLVGAREHGKPNQRMSAAPGHERPELSVGASNRPFSRSIQGVPELLRFLNTLLYNACVCSCVPADCRQVFVSPQCPLSRLLALD